MNWKNYSVLFLSGVIIFSLFAWWQTAPGYMDAEYYFSMGLRIARDGTFSEPFLWNYLHPLREVPHPGFTYWMPGPALVAAGGMLISGMFNFSGAKIGSLLLAGFVPVLTAMVGFKLSEKESTGILAGLLALVPVLYIPFMGTTDSFGLMMVLGGLFVLASFQSDRLMNLLAIGAISGLMHFSRADGLIWVGIGLLIALGRGEKKFKRLIFVLTGYLLIMGPWFARNFVSMGEFLPSGNSSVLWMTTYNDLFIFDPSSLTFRNWMHIGWPAITGNIWQALLANIKTGMLVQGQLILAPLIAIGFWTNRKKNAVWPSAVGLVLIFFVMTVVFPFAGQRGGYLHSGAAVQVLLWSLAAIGFEKVINFGVKSRGWETNRANVLFGSGLILILFCSTIFVYLNRVIGGDLKNPQWNRSYKLTEEIDSILDDYQPGLVMINNPPGYFAATGKSAIVIPAGDVEDVLSASQEFGADYLILEINHPDHLADLYQNPGDRPGLELISTAKGVHIYGIISESQ